MLTASHLPACAGVGFKPVHFGDILASSQPVGFFEVHAENYMGAGGPPLTDKKLERLQRRIGSPRFGAD